MTADTPRVSDDDLLRSSLRAEADAVRPNPDWADVEARAAHASWRVPVLAVAAAAAAVAIVVGALAITRTDPAPTRVTTDPTVDDTAPTTTADPGTRGFSIATGRTADATPLPMGTAPLGPDELVAVIAAPGADESVHDLVVLDTAGNIVRTLLAEYGASEGGIFELSVTTDRTTVVFAVGTSACDAAVLAVPVDGSSAPLELFGGGETVVSPGSRWLARDLQTGCATVDQLELVPVAGGETLLVDLGTNGSLSSLAFVDDDTLWFVLQQGDVGTLHELDLESMTVEAIDPLLLGGSYERLDSVGDGTVTVVHRCCAADDEWTLLVIDGAGSRASSTAAGRVMSGAFTAVGVVESTGFVGDQRLSVNGEPIRSDVFLAAVPSVPQTGGTAEGLAPVTVLDGATTLRPEESARAASVVEAFIRAFAATDFETAATYWDGYPDVDGSQPGAVAAHLERLHGEALWPFQDNDARAHEVLVTPGWSFTGGVAVVTHFYESDPDGQADSLSFLVGFDDAGAARITRLPDTPRDDVTPAAGAVVSPGDVIVFDAVPTEGGVRAFFGTREVRTTVDHEAFTTSVVVPSDIAGEVVLIASFATPEIATASSFVFRVA